ncbi:hypothetical protein [Oscillibacter ruminantium]
MARCEKRPALLGEVDGGRALATTRLYPALFSTEGTCRIREPVRLSKRPAQSLYVAVWGGMGYGCHIRPENGTRGRTGGNAGGYVQWAVCYFISMPE